MARRTLLLSLLAALAAAAVFRLYLHRLQREVAGGEPAAVLALTRDLAVGERLEDDSVATRSLPRAYLESRHIPQRARADVLGQRLSIAGKAGETLLWTDLASAASPNRQLSSLVPEGMRAVAVVLAAGGFDELLRPGDRVDVMSTPHGGDVSTRVVLQNVLVLAVGADLGAPGAPRARGRGGSVTLGVDVEQARRLADAEATSTLRLSLRHPDDIVIQGEVQGASTPPTAGGTVL